MLTCRRRVLEYEIVAFETMFYRNLNVTGRQVTLYIVIYSDINTTNSHNILIVQCVELA